MLIPRSFLSFAMNTVQIGLVCDTLHVDFFNGICQKSNNEKDDVTKIHIFYSIF